MCNDGVILILLKKNKKLVLLTSGCNEYFEICLFCPLSCPNYPIFPLSPSTNF